MKILVDENIPYGREAFASLGEVTTMAGRAMDVSAVAAADLLMVRSITKVNASLLDGSKVRFVATATIGEDHIDKAYLAERGIGFSSAPGCNANSVGQYITSALMALSDRFELDLSGMSLGIVGVGNVGKRVLAKASALGLTCVLNDPPLARETGDAKYRPLDEVFGCDIVTLHVPLTKEGEDATYHLADETFIRSLTPGAILLNSSRGPVADGEAVKRALDDGHLRACVLDVWEGEPRVDAELLRKVFIGTPHIAGYSFDGKVNGTRQIYEAACAFLGESAKWDPSPLLPEPECPRVTVDGTRTDTQVAIRDAVYAVYDVARDDKAMRAILGAPEEERGALFDRLRKEYPRRREFFNTVAKVTPGNPELERILSGIGFQVKTD
jgi:erythronate-4-phosphate dehydrogenase